MRILAVDVGGTNVRIGLYDAAAIGQEPELHQRFASADYEGLDQILIDAVEQHKPACIGIGVAGPVVDGVAKVTNLPWQVHAADLSRALGLPVTLVNDLEAQGHGLAYLPTEKLSTLQAGEQRSGNRVIIAAGTGLGECLVFWDGQRYHPSPSEGSHANFGPVTARDCELLSFMLKKYDHVSWERVCSGKDGMRSLYEFMQQQTGGASAELQAAANKEDDIAEEIVAAAQTGDAFATELVAWFCELYGAEAGNLALKAMATGGVYVSGGVTPHIQTQLLAGGFLKAFLHKGRFHKLLSRMPVHLVLDHDLGLYGAAAAAAHAQAPNH